MWQVLFNTCVYAKQNINLTTWPNGSLVIKTGEDCLKLPHF